MPTKIIDCHQHFWRPGLIDIPWLPTLAASSRDAWFHQLYGPAEYRRGAAPVTILGTVHVEAAAHPDHGLLETVWVTGLADADGLPSAIVSYADIEAPDLEAVLGGLKRSPRVRGVRMRLGFDEPSGRRVARSATVMEGAAFRRGLRLVAEHDLLFELNLFSPQLRMAAELANDLPDLTLVLEHAGWPLTTDREGFREWRSGMALLAACPNVVVKLCALRMIDPTWSAELLGPWVRETFALFGAQRCLFGSDLPFEQSVSPLPRQVEILAGILGDQSEQNLRDFFVDNATRVYKITANPGPVHG